MQNLGNTSIAFEIKFLDGSKKHDVEAIFDFTNPFTNCRMTRISKFLMNHRRGNYYKDTLKDYIQFMINNKMITESTLLLSQDKMLKYILFQYPQSYPHTKKNTPPGIDRYFKRTQYDRFCIGGDADNLFKETSANANSVSVYPNRLLAPQESGTTTLILGSSFTGKTYLLAEELDMIKPFEYDLIILFTESLHVPQIQKFKERPDIIIKEGFHEEIPLFLKKLNSKLKNRFRFLLILDDIISEKSSRKSTLGKMLTTYRNSNISTCVLAQYPTIISKESRTNFHQLVVTGMRSPESNKAMTDRFDIMSWAKERMKKDIPNQSTTIKQEETLNYLKKMLMENGVVMYIDLKRSLDPALVDLRT
jgi:hypothetical protein